MKKNTEFGAGLLKSKNAYQHCATPVKYVSCLKQLVMSYLLCLAVSSTTCCVVRCLKQ